MSRTKPAEVRFYVDADLLGLARVLAGLRSDVTYPGDPGAVVHKRLRPPCPITSPAVKDSDWIPEVARRGWLIITRDRHIQAHRLEIQAVREHGAKMIALNGTDARSIFAQLEVVMCRWRDIERYVADLPPFIYSATRTAIRPIPLV
jgi:PIN domain-containing protein